MKKSLFVISAALLCFMISCSNKGGGKMSATAQKNLDGMHSILKMFETGDFSKFTDYVTADAVDHAGEKGDVTGADNIKADLIKFAAMGTNQKNEIVKDFADDDYAMCWVKETGTMKTDGMGMKAGDNYTWNMIEVSKCKDGKATDHWSFLNTTDMMKMMPQAPPMVGNKADTTK